MPECNDSNKTIGILLGILVGAFFVYIILKRDQTPTLSIDQMQQQMLQRQHAMIQQPTNQHLDWQSMDIPRVDDIKPQTQQQTLPCQETLQTITPHTTIDPSLVQMTSHLQKATSQLEDATSRLQETIIKIQHNNSNIPQQPIIIQQPVQPQQPQIIVRPQPTQSQENLQQASNTLYKNNEKWSITRGPDGRIKSLEIIRDVKKNG